MRHEHEPANSQDADILAGLPEKDATHEQARMSTARGIGQKSETDLDSLTKLLQTLVMPLPPRSALLRVLSLGLSLIPSLRVLSLFALPDGTRATLTLVSTIEHTPEDAEPTAHDLWRRHPSLGHGEPMDQRTLDDRMACRQGNVFALPLVSPAFGLIGALVGEKRRHVRGHEGVQLVDALAHCLTVLLERQGWDEAASRRTRVLTTLGKLAPRITEAIDWSGAVERARDAVLRDAAAAVGELALPLACVALAPSPDGTLRMIDASADGSLEIEPVRGVNLLSVLRGRTILVASTARERDVWDDLTALRELAYQSSGLEVARLTLLALQVESDVVGLVLLAHAAGGLDERHWLPDASAIMRVAGMGLGALRLAETAAAETHARDEFISLAAHELRNPLTSIKGYAQLLVRQASKTSVPDAMLRSMEAIQQQGLRLSEMVGELLDASRIRRGVLDIQRRKTDLVPLTQGLVEKRQAYYPRHTVVLQIEAPSLVGYWDAQRVEQIISDLLDNAARYSPEAGTITIRLAKADSSALLSVRDQGIGIAPEDRARIFDYLYRARFAEERNLSGLGLGLYISRHLAERMGGQLVLYEPAHGGARGSEFRLLLPLG